MKNDKHIQRGRVKQPRRAQFYESAWKFHASGREGIVLVITFLLVGIGTGKAPSAESHAKIALHAMASPSRVRRHRAIGPMVARVTLRCFLFR